jgi:hypothetical protein
MAQADSVPSSTRQLITGESANQSTNLRAVNLPAVGMKPANRRNLISGCDAVVITGSKAPLPRPWREKRDEPEDLSNGPWYGVDTGQVPFGPNIGVLFYATAVFLLGCLPRNILLILLRCLSRNKRLRFGALNKVSSNQLVQSSRRRG